MTQVIVKEERELNPIPTKHYVPGVDVKPMTKNEFKTLG